MDEADGVLSIAAGNLVAAFSRASGLLTGLAFNGQELLAAPLEPNFWRPTTDNDYGAHLQKDFACWRHAGGAARLTKGPTVACGEVSAAVEVELAVGAGASLAVKYDVSPGGVGVSAEWRPGRDDGPRAAVAGGVAYLRSHQTSHLDVEGKLVRARWADRGEFQSITVHAAGRDAGQPLRHGDKVALQAVTGKTEAETLLHGLAPTATARADLPKGLAGVGVEATEEPTKPLWTVMRLAGEGAIVSGDQVVFEADRKCLAVVNDWAAALESEGEETPPQAVFTIEIKEYPAPPRVGFKGLLHEGFEDVQWFGRGPHESYVDRYVSARVGLFESSILDQTFKYVRPQENGNKMDTRWMALKRAAGKDASCAGLLIVSQAPSSALAMQCHRYSLGDFDGGEDKAKQAYLHAGELVQRADTAFCVDVAQMGVGGIDSWCSRPLKQHMIGSTQEFEWAFQLRPVSPEDAAAGYGALARRPRR